MKLYLCDDEVKIRREIEKCAQLCMPEAEMAVFSSGKELLEHLRKEACDILLLDIDMPECSGMEVAANLLLLEKRPLLVFVTGHDELVYESFQYHPFGFVRKQFLDVELGKVLADCKKELEQRQRHFNFRTAEGEVCLLLSEICYFESDANYLKIGTEQKEYRFRSTIGAVEAALAKEGFLRIHKGFLVNQEFIRMFGTEQVELTDGKVLPVGKMYGEAAKQQFMRYLRV